MFPVRPTAGALPSAPIDEFTGLEASRFGVYVHFPYCLSKCPYCDFASTAAKEIPDGRYTDALLLELERRAALLTERPEVQSIFIGGGTPSLWAPRSVERVLSALAKTFRVAERCEVTLEANPGASDAERFQAYRAAGVNRLSMGVQSFDWPTLQRLGRAHDGPTAHRAFERARAAGFTNVSMDFIYGVHGQTVAEVERDAREAISLGSEHLSAYALTLDKPSLAEDVPLAKQLARGDVKLPDDEVVIEMQRVVRDVFRSAGLARYEVSNYAKTVSAAGAAEPRVSAHSRHNAAYWTGGEYLALGTGATGFVGRERYTNHRSADRYLTDALAGRLPQGPPEQLSRLELFEERVAMGLRLTNGIALDAVCARFEQPWDSRAVTVRQLVASGLAHQTQGRLALTDAGFDVHSAIAARLM